MRNNRNYYRILHVQFDAPAAVIKASYRAIMQKLRAHPDLGGEECIASLINEARDVLLDPARRAEYDAQFSVIGSATDSNADRMHTRRGSNSDLGGRPNREHEHSESAAYSKDKSPSYNQESNVESLTFNAPPSCPFCHERVSQQPTKLQAYPTAHRCTNCESPLKDVDGNWMKKQDDLRRIHRAEYDQPIRVWHKWPRDSGYSANVCDWSTAGCCLQMNSVLKVGSVVLLLSDSFDAIATIRYQSGDTFLGLEFLTLEVKMQPGSLYASAA